MRKLSTILTLCCCFLLNAHAINVDDNETGVTRTDAVEITTWTYAWVDGYLEVIDETTSTFGDE